jgi:uncharacterized LabA/DUF88 family protein
MSENLKKQSAQTIAIFADCQNVGLIKYSEAILHFVQQLGEAAFLWAYHDWKKVRDTKQKRLQEQGWQCLNVISDAKNAVDKRLICDCQRLFQSWIPDIVVLISCDQDFVPLVDEVIRQGKQVIIIGRQNHVSHRLMKRAPNNVYFVENLNNVFKAA